MQAKIYEEDFKTEREDRAKAFDKMEKCKEEIEALKENLSIQKMKLSDLEKVHQARMKEQR